MPGSKPEVRYSWEPLNPGSGTTSDPLNHTISLDYMHHVPRTIADVDFTWARHFLSQIEQGNKKASRFLHAVEYHHAGQSDLKSYFLPRNYKLPQGGDPTTLGEWKKAIKQLDPRNANCDVLMEFLEKNSEGRLLTPA
jgi:hypothetical protein